MYPREEWMVIVSINVGEQVAFGGIPSHGPPPHLLYHQRHRGPGLQTAPDAPSQRALSQRRSRLEAAVSSREPHRERLGNACQGIDRRKGPYGHHVRQSFFKGDGCLDAPPPEIEIPDTPKAFLLTPQPGDLNGRIGHCLGREHLLSLGGGTCPVPRRWPTTAFKQRHDISVGSRPPP